MFLFLLSACTPEPAAPKETGDEPADTDTTDDTATTGDAGTYEGPFGGVMTAREEGHPCDGSIVFTVLPDGRITDGWASCLMDEAYTYAFEIRGTLVDGVASGVWRLDDDGTLYPIPFDGTASDGVVTATMPLFSADTWTWEGSFTATRG